MVPALPRFLVCICIFVTAFSVSVFASDWRPDSPVKYSVSVNPKVAASMIRNGAPYRLLDFSFVEEQAEHSRNGIALLISKIDAEITKIVADRQSLVKLHDLEEMKKELAAKNKNYAEMKRSLIENLTAVSRKGLWLVVIDGVQQFASKEDLRSKAEAALAPQAISAINGTFIESITEVSNNQLIRDYIRSEVSGAMQVDNIHQQLHRKASGRFIYLAQIGVTSLKDAISVGTSSSLEQGRVHVVDLSTAGSVSDLCAGCELSKDDLELVHRGIDNLRATVAAQNDAAAIREKMILDESSQHFKELSNEIKVLESNISNRDGRIRIEVQRLCGITCKRNADDCIPQAVKRLDSRIDSLQQKKMDLKSNEIITQRTQVRPETGDPALDVANIVSGVVAQIDKSYGKLEQFLEVTEVNNYMLTSYSALQKRDLFRTADTVWVYASPQDDETFQVLVAVKFSVTSKRPNEPLRQDNTHSSYEEAGKTQNSAVSTSTYAEKNISERTFSPSMNRGKKSPKEYIHPRRKASLILLLTSGAFVGLGFGMHALSAGLLSSSNELYDDFRSNPNSSSWDAYETKYKTYHVFLRIGDGSFYAAGGFAILSGIAFFIKEKNPHYISVNDGHLPDVRFTCDGRALGLTLDTEF